MQLTIQTGTITWPATFTHHDLYGFGLHSYFLPLVNDSSCRVPETDANIMNNSGVLSHKPEKINIYQLLFNAANVLSS